ncbi:hypothetical protein [Undibacterium terreum]|uniref:Uncharacterized protein n=1 Tax=Undibacterium terreum TaxID=1224302 RepID=A0A916XGA6_9BURK|nr:hypothetical protein [Undibacterium terreum]GGC69961.1 hypothetical protein GCM10011396_16240 [Undibacterium terreum]
MIAAELLKRQSNDQYYTERREKRAPFFTLIEMDPRDLVSGIEREEGYLSEDITPAGTMRETCPHCPGNALLLVLRYKQVKRSHLFCEQCTRCYDALYPDGTSALAIGGVSLV